MNLSRCENSLQRRGHRFEEERWTLGQCLTNEGYEVVEAENGRIAQEILNTGSSFDLVISDIKMPRMTGLELLKWIKSQMRTPVILVTGFSEILKTQEAYDLGADGFLPKPFEPEDIFQAIKSVADSPPESKRQDFDQSYCRIAIDQFVGGSEIAYNIYIRLSKSKYVKIDNVGQNISAERIPTLKSRSVAYLYLTKDDFRKYVGFTLDLTKTVKNADHIPIEKKRTFLQQTGELIVGQLYIGGADQESFNQTKDYLDTIYSLLFDNDNAVDTLMRLNQHTEAVYTHSLGVSIYGVMIARELKFWL